MVPIVLCSVTALAIFLERIWALHRPKVLPGGLMKLVQEVLRAGKPGEAETLCASSDTAIAQVALAGVRKRNRPRSVIMASMAERGRHEIALLNRHIPGLGTIASVAPLLGLLGTVAGMIRVFRQVVDDVGARGEVNPGSLANGIWEALLTTAAGLSVAIPTYVAYRYLEGRIDRLAIEMEEYSSGLVDTLERCPQPQTAGSGELSEGGPAADQPAEVAG